MRLNLDPIIRGTVGALLGLGVVVSILALAFG
jgi:hypothetical protein